MKTLDKFLEYTGYDLEGYLIRIDDFFSSRVNVIVQYYKGVEISNKDAFNELNSLVSESIRISQIIDSNKDILSNDTSFWDILEAVSDVSSQLKTVVNLGKWMRSSYIFGYEDKMKQMRVLKQNQTFENLSSDMGSFDPNYDWVSIAVANQIMEVDYDKSGGVRVYVDGEFNASQIINNSVVDIMVGDLILGKDIQREFIIEDNDIVSLGTEDTMFQSADICISVYRGSVPENPSIGISKELVGSNMLTLRTFSLFREVSNNFSTDGSFREIEILDLRVEEDNLVSEFMIRSILNDEIKKKL